MATTSFHQGKENVPPGQKPRRMKMILSEHDDDDVIVRLATPQKKTPLATIPTAPTTYSVPSLPIASAAPEHDSDDDVVIVIKPRSPRSPSIAVAPAIAEEARKVLAETSAPISISIATPIDSITISDILAIAAPAPAMISEPVVELAKIAEKHITAAELTDDTVVVVPLAQVGVPESSPVATEESAAPGVLIITEEKVTKSAEETAVQPTNATTVEEHKEDAKEAEAMANVQQEEAKNGAAEQEAEETKSAEEQRAEELAARSAARIEAETAAQARRAQLEAKLTELQALNLPQSDMARNSRTAVEERMAAVEEAWRKKIEGKSGTQILAQVRSASATRISLRKRSANSIADANAVAVPHSSDPNLFVSSSSSSSTLSSSSSYTSSTSCTIDIPPPSPSIEERKQRIERLKTERIEMKLRLESSRANGAQRKDAGKKKSLRWADDAGDKLTMATSYLVSSGDRPMSIVPPPLPETPAPTEIPARYLEI